MKTVKQKAAKPQRHLSALAVFFASTVLTGCATVSKEVHKNLSFQPGMPVIDQVNQGVTQSSEWFRPLLERSNKAFNQYRPRSNQGIGPYLEADIYLFNDEELDIYLHDILHRLAEPLNFELPELKIIVESNPRFSAYVDEFIQIHLSTGLLRSLSNEDQVAGVIAHELGHIVLRHNLEKKAHSSVTSMIGIASSMTSQLAGNRRARSSLDFSSEDTLRAANSLDTVALLWTDLLEPSWSRNNEREADQFAMDVMKAAGYNHEELITAVSKIHDANAVRSQRLNRLNQISGELIAQQKEALLEGRDKEYQQSLGETSARLVANLTDKGLSFLAEKGASHDDKNTRIGQLKNYINTTYSLYELPAETREQKFNAIVKRGNNGQDLKSDLAAVETMIAISKRNMSAARQRLADINANAYDSPQMAAAIARSAIDVANRDYDSALNKLEELSKDPHAPAEVFIKVAKLHASKRQYTQAEQALLEGAERVGRRYRFLPTLIQLYRKQRLTDMAESATLECGNYDNDSLLQVFSMVSEINLSKPNSYYRHCADVLGYDVRAKRNEERLQKIEELQMQGSKFMERLLK